ncbi:MAG TPA: Gfo/Idh/MocA family oxidoreductase [Gemmatimonadales bacterium]|nr:Gfo/Idh/MocA family oxidoreductase [Gemmatimonadales bacterium]
MLDAWRDPASDVRLAVDAWWVSAPISDQYIVRPKSAFLVWNYLRRIGPLAVWRKVVSRLAERLRNLKVAGLGVGRVIEAPTSSGLSRGQSVVFFAPNHSPAWPRICVDQRFVFSTSEVSGISSPVEASDALSGLRRFIGWTSYSGIAVDERVLRDVLAPVLSAMAVDTHPSTPRSVSALPSEIRERHATNGPMVKRPSAVLFGAGNYAKTQILPVLRRRLNLAAIHEIDPDQIAGIRSLDVTTDTCPRPRPGETFDAWFIAGYHHTHAGLGVHALQSGAYAVIEKPLATTLKEFLALQQAVMQTPRMFACFHRRYSRMNDWARVDLGVALGDPVDMHCIVYEIPLPAHHWYNWPNSGSRIISNGCHWLDYFMFINGYPPVADFAVQALRGKDVLMSVRLANDARLVLSLTDNGSERLGVRDVIELRAATTTIRMTDASYYESENSVRVLRRRRINPMDSYRRMYDSICACIVAGQNGDSQLSLRSTQLSLDLEDALGASGSAPARAGRSAASPTPSPMAPA